MFATFRENYSHQTKDTLLLEYKYKVEALTSKVELLEAKLEVITNPKNR
jgi:BMFP domain-containing protein YqiC